ncbi:MAG: hypothetical protein ACXWCM_01235 [Acidimicrobiales bacterium]
MAQDAGNEGGIQIGSALVTLVDPHKGSEVAYNRWYERDHFYAGCLIGAGWFAGKRWVATKPLKDLRGPADSVFLPDISAGSYLATYWVLKDMAPEAIAWGTRQVNWLHEHGRMYDERDHVHTLIYANRFAASRDADGVPAELALDHPWGGLVLLMVDRHEDVSPKEATAWLRDDLLPEAMAGTPWALTVGLTPIPLPKEAPVFQPPNPGEERRTAMLCFLECDPRECWEVFEGLGEKVSAGGIADVSYYAPFLPTIPGTDTYTDQLW